MSELTAYKCPSCGANLKVTEGQELLTCSFCSSVFKRDLAQDEKEKVSAAQLAASTEKYRSSLLKHNELVKKLSRISDEIGALSQKDNSMPLWTMFTIPFYILCAVLLVFMFDKAVSTEDKPLMALTALIFLAVFIAAIVTYSKKAKARKQLFEQNEKLKGLLSELGEKRAELEALDSSFDIDTIPKAYRSEDSLEYIIGAFRSGQAHKLGDAFALYDNHRHNRTMEALQREQVEIQKKQLEILDELSDYGADDTYDDDDFRLDDALNEMRERL